MQFVAELSAMAIGIIGFAALAWQDALIFTAMGWLLLPLIILDFRHLWLPNRLSFILGVAGFAMGYFWAADYDWRVQIISAAIIFTAMELLRRGFLWLRNVEGMGAGDPKLMAAIALWLPPLSLPYLLLLASGGGLLLLLIIPNDGDIRAQKLPLGSLLGISAIALLFCHFRFGWF
jgi:leader peptidase (prepilin peptidase)/N-methyltransferase